MLPIKLKQKNLASLPATIAVPNYDRSGVSAGIVHIGVGNFHRAHQAVYMDRLFRQGRDHDWGIIGAGIKPYDTNIRSVLENQDWLSPVIELDPKGLSALVCGSMIDFTETSSESLIETLTRSEIRIVSMTITEGGYFIDPLTGGFDINHPEVQYDSQNPQNPLTVFGALVVALEKRKEEGVPPFTVMSCDNIPSNGRVTKQAVVGFANSMKSDIADWIAGEVAFPNSMVDCITPATGNKERALASEQFGIDGAGVVVCEPFRQWVIEDNFPQGRPAWEEVGVQFIDDVEPYELMKLRILNGGHAAIAYPSALLGLKFANNAMENANVNGFMRKLVATEIIPTLSPIQGVDYNQYLDQTMERFGNAAIGDTIARLCFDGSNRQPKFILPIISERLKCGLPINGLALEVALWCRYCAGTDEDGNATDLQDENADRLRKNALKAKTSPRAFIGMADIFGTLSANDVFAAEFSKALDALWANGTAASLQAYSDA